MERVNILCNVWVWGYFWGIKLLLVQNLRLYSCSVTLISCKGEISRISRLIL